MKPSPLSHLDRQAIKALTRVAVDRAGGQENCANVSGRIDRPATFSDYANPALPNKVIALDAAVELDAFNGDAAHVRWAAARLGYELRRSASAPACDGTLLTRAGVALKECADVISAIAGGLADGTLCADDARRIARESREALPLLQAVIDAAEAMIAGGE